MMEIAPQAAAAAGPETGSVLLLLLVLVPLLGGILLMFVPREQTSAHRGIGVAISLVAFAMSLPLLTGFDSTAPGFQAGFDFSMGWIASIGASLTLQVDGISIWIVLLTTFLTPIILIGAFTAVEKRVREFVIALKEAVPMPIRTWDERLTSVTANRLLSEGNVRGEKRKEKVDKVAAAVLLQSYLDSAALN